MDLLADRASYEGTMRQVPHRGLVQKRIKSGFQQTLYRLEKQLFNTSTFVLDAPQIPVVHEQISVI
jgi:hypothetical protein